MRKLYLIRQLMILTLNFFPNFLKRKQRKNLMKSINHYYKYLLTWVLRKKKTLHLPDCYFLEEIHNAINHFLLFSVSLMLAMKFLVLNFATMNLQLKEILLSSL